MHYPKVRDESFITRGSNIQRGVGIFLVMYWGVENKKPLGHGGHTFHQVFEGVRCVPLDFAFIKSQSFWGPSPPDPPPHIPNDTANNIKYSKNKKNKKRLQNK